MSGDDRHARAPAGLDVARNLGGRAPDPTRYAPGVCNIGPEEVERRRRSAMSGAIVTAGIAGAMLVLGAPRRARLAIAVPAAGTAVAALQVRDRFCVAYATRGVENVADPLGMPLAVPDAGSRALDRRHALGMIARGLLVGAVAAIAFAALP